MVEIKSPVGGQNTGKCAILNGVKDLSAGKEILRPPTGGLRMTIKSLRETQNDNKKFKRDSKWRAVGFAF